MASIEGSYKENRVYITEAEYEKLKFADNTAEVRAGMRQNPQGMEQEMMQRVPVKVEGKGTVYLSVMRLETLAEDRAEDRGLSATLKAKLHRGKEFAPIEKDKSKIKEVIRLQKENVSLLTQLVKKL